MVDYGRLFVALVQWLTLGFESECFCAVQEEIKNFDISDLDLI